MCFSLSYYCLDMLIHGISRHHLITHLPQRVLKQLTTFGNICRYFCFSQLGWGEVGSFLVSRRQRSGCCPSLQCTAQPPIMKHFLTQNVNSVKAEKPCSPVLKTQDLEEAVHCWVSSAFTYCRHYRTVIGSAPIWLFIMSVLNM